MTGIGDDPFVTAVKPLVDAMGGEMLPPGEAGPTTSCCPGRAPTSSPYGCRSSPTPWTTSWPPWSAGAGKPLAELDRKAKQEVVRILEARGAFSVRHGVETVAGALGVSRFTVYNYLNREKAAKSRRT